MLLDITKRHFRKSICINYAKKRVRIKRGYGRTDGWIDGGRTNGRMSGGRTDGRMAFKKRFSAFFESYSRFILLDKTRTYPRFFSKRIKRGYIRLLYILLDKTRIYPRFIQKDKTRTWSKKRFSAFFASYQRFIQKDKTRIWSRKRFFSLFLVISACL